MTCTCISTGAQSGAELGENLLGSLRGAAICGVVRACTLQGRELCLVRCVVGPVTALPGVCLQDAGRGVRWGGKRLLASRLRPVSKQATNPTNYLSLHRPVWRYFGGAPVWAGPPPLRGRPPVGRGTTTATSRHLGDRHAGARRRGNGNRVNMRALAHREKLKVPNAPKPLLNMIGSLRPAKNSFSVQWQSRP